MWLNFFYFISFFPKIYILATRCKKVEFWPFLDMFCPFLRTPWLKRKKIGKVKKFLLVLENMATFFILLLLFLSFTFWPPGVKKLNFDHFCTCFGQDIQYKWRNWIELFIPVHRNKIHKYKISFYEKDKIKDKLKHLFSIQSHPWQY